MVPKKTDRNISFKRKLSEKRNLLPAARGFSPSGGMKVSEFLAASATLGFQATQLGRAVEILKEARKEKAAVFMSITSNIVSSGLREVVAAMCERKLVDAIVTTTGSIEEDIMKTKFDFFLGEFDEDDTLTKKRGLNRIGNVFVPDEAYCWLEDFDNSFLPEFGENLVPNEYCRRAGERLADGKSFLYWAAKNKIPVFLPGFVDGAIGDHIYFYNQGRAKKLVVNQSEELKKFYDLIISAEKTAGLIIGGGIAKHHLIGAAILRNGLDYAVYVSTGTAGDGSLSGARPTEAVSWNKLKDRRNSAFVEAEATLALPLIVAGISDKR
ncbi:MAG: deoxyhypusine synthase family protein [archaeon]